MFITLYFNGQNLRVTISGDTLKMNGVVMSEHWSIGSFKKILGNGRGPVGLQNTHMYDSLGIILYETRKNKVLSGNVEEAGFYFLPYTYDNSRNALKGAFSKEFYIDAVKINKDLTLESLQTSLKNNNWKKIASPHNLYKCERGKIYIYLHFDRSGKSLEHLSVGHTQ